VVRCHSIFVLLLLAVGCASKPGRGVPDEAERKAVAYLVREVPAWSRENQCFSCHNNGDAARALYVASRQGHHVPASALEDTSAWLGRPEQWKNNKGDPGFSDPRLANLQFAAALLTAFQTGHIKDEQALSTAAALVGADQGQDGSWPVEPSNPVGSPATYGTPLATYIAAQIVRSAPFGRSMRYQSLRNWFGGLKPSNVPDAAALLQFENSNSAREFILRAQTSDGGWGPYADSPPEAFDTALALLALKGRGRGHSEAMERGRKFLVSQQRSDGSWPATTRPSGGESYAQTVSTTAWATLALLATRP
jgi:hypothetical protein